MTSNAIRNREILTNLMAKREQLHREALERAEDRSAAMAREHTKGIYNISGQAIKGAIGAAALANAPAWYKAWPFIDKVMGKGETATYVATHVRYKQGAYNPAVAVFYYDDTYGPLETPAGTSTSAEMLPINEAALRYQTDLYSYNSVLATVAASDVMQYSLAAVDIVELMCEIARACKAYKTFDPNCFNFNEKLVSACGWSVADMKANYKNIISWLNTEIESFNRDIAIPAKFTILDRKTFLCSGAWADDEGKNSTIFITRRLHYHIWSEAQGKLIPYNVPQYWDFVTAVQVYNNMKAALVGSSNIVELIRNIKSGAKNGLELLTVPLFEESDLPIYPVDEVLEQLMNSYCLPRFADASGGIIAVYSDTVPNFWSNLPAGYYLNQDSNGFLVPTHLVNGTTPTPYRGSEITTSASDIASIDLTPEVMNFLHDDVSYDDLLVATRLKPLWRLHVQSGKAYFDAPRCGTEVIIGLEITFPSGLSVGQAVLFPSSAGTNILNSLLPLHAKPICYGIPTGAYSSVSINSVWAEWHSMVLIDEKTQYAFDRGAVLSEFYLNAPVVDARFKFDKRHDSRNTKNKKRKPKGTDKPAGSSQSSNLPNNQNTSK